MQSSIPTYGQTTRDTHFISHNILSDVSFSAILHLFYEDKQMYHYLMITVEHNMLLNNDSRLISSMIETLYNQYYTLHVHCS